MILKYLTLYYLAQMVNATKGPAMGTPKPKDWQLMETVKANEPTKTPVFDEPIEQLGSFNNDGTWECLIQIPPHKVDQLLTIRHGLNNTGGLDLAKMNRTLTREVRRVLDSHLTGDVQAMAEHRQRLIAAEQTAKDINR